jgi:hypothetical protein
MGSFLDEKYALCCGVGSDVEVFAQGFGSIITQIDDSVLLPLAIVDKEPSLDRVNIGENKAGHFADSEAAAQHKGEDGAISWVLYGSKQKVDLLVR